MAEIVISVAAKVAEYSVGPIARQIGYVWNYKSSVDNLETEVRKLEGRRQEVQHSVEEARSNGEEIEQHVQDWMGRVQNIFDEASEVVQQKEHPSMKCFKGLCPNPKKRCQYSRKAVKKAKVVAQLHDEGNFAKVSYRTVPQEIWIPSHKGYEAFKSRISTLKDILTALMNPDVNMIGIYGTGGIGKTTLAREVAARVEDKKLFDVVAFAEVTVKPDIKEIQQEIADKLGLTFHEESASGRARSLQQRLKQEETVLLVLDNIWERLNLEDVGIPFGNDHKGCKILLTARSSDVLSKMDSQSNFQIGVLGEEEAWNLFKKKAGFCTENNDHLQASAEKVAEACGGLPIAITSVAVALKGKGVSVWKDALTQLKRPSAGSFEGVAAETYSCIEISYNQLKGEELKSTFLLCSIMGHTSIEDLLAYGMGLGMFNSIHAIEEGRNRVFTLVQQLKDSSLLLDADNKRFSLHDVVCDVARSIAYRDRHMFTVTSNVLLKELVDNKDVLKSCIKISLHDISELPTELKCPQLKFLYVRTKEALLEFPNNFFEGTPELKVLHLVGNMNLDSYSLGSLENLETLYIDNCHRVDLHFIGEVKQLQFLRLCGGKLQELPKKIRNCTRLRLLNLNDCYILRNIPPNVLSTLTQLEELFWSGRSSEIRWMVDGVNILDELKHLSLLSTLEIEIPDADALPKGRLLSNKLERYKIYIGTNSGYSYETSRSREVKFNLGKSSRSDHNTPSVEKFLSILDGEGFPELEILNVEWSPCFRTVVDCLKSESCDPFPFLKSLTLVSLSNLENIYNRQLRVESFHQLRTIGIEWCHNLKNIFSLSSNRALPLLQEVRVSRCDNMEEIFVMGREEDINNNEGTNQIEFKQLHSLYLTDIPKLTSVCTINSSEVSAPNSLFNEKVVFSNLEDLYLVGINIEGIWHNKLSAECSCFQLLRRLTIAKCPNIKVIFSSSTVAFPSLEEIKIVNMKDLEMIWSQQLYKDSFCNLKSMEVKYCNKLATIFQSNMLERMTRSLESLTDKHCDLVEKIFDLPEVDFEESHPGAETRLPVQDIDCLPNLKPQKMFCFQKLKDVKVDNCRSLKYLFPIYIAKSLPELVVSNCTDVETIVADEGEAKEVATFVFPQLISLELRHFPKLFQETNEGQDNISVPPLFMVEKDSFPNLEKLILSGEVVKLVLQGQFPEQLFCNLKCLEVSNDESVVFPLCNLQRFRHLQELHLDSCLYEEIVSYEEAETCAGTSNPSVWNRDSKLDTVLHKLESLEVETCSNLIQQVPSSMSFQNITVLNLWRCHRLKNLVMPSMAKSLVQLREMTIDGCNSMMEVVAKEGDVTQDNIIIFSKLRTLKLTNLPSLTCFCSENYIFELPVLENLTVNWCPKMKYFSPVITTRILRKVELNLKHYTLEGNLNTTIQQAQDSRNQFEAQFASPLQ